MGKTTQKNKKESEEIMTQQEKTTHDLFSYEPCLYCNGDGEVEVENTKHSEEIEDCEICKGTGVAQ